MRSKVRDILGTRECLGCGKSFEPRRIDQKIHGRSQRGFSDCERRYRRSLYIKADKRLRSCSWSACGALFIPHKSDQRYCSQEHRDRAHGEQFLTITVQVPRKLLTTGGISGIIDVVISENKVSEVRSAI